MSSPGSRKVEGWRARGQREHDELLQAVRKRDGAFYLLEDGEAVIRVQGEHANTVGRKGRKSLYLRNETGVQELKQSSALRLRIYKAEWSRLKRVANPGFRLAQREAKRRARANRTPEQAAHDRLVAQIYAQLLSLAGLAPWQRKSKSRAPDLCFAWSHHLGEAE